MAGWAPFLGKLLDGTPMIVVDHGHPLRARMHMARIDEEDIREAARRLQGIERLDQIKYAVLEVSGGITVIPNVGSNAERRRRISSDPKAKIRSSTFDVDLLLGQARQARRPSPSLQSRFRRAGRQRPPDPQARPELAQGAVAGDLIVLHRLGGGHKPPRPKGRGIAFDFASHVALTDGLITD